MGELVDPQNTRDIIRKYNFVVRKKYGQNFLVDRDVLEKIVKASGVTADDCVLEIGPGIGTMTQRLAEEAGHVVAVEIDRKLIPILDETLAGYDNVTVINKDILKVDIAELAEEYNGGKPMKVVANLPYYITTPIIMRILEDDLPIENITVMIQKEVADRMQVGPGTKDYGALSLSVQYYADPEIIAYVPPNCFIPRPAIDSAVIRLTKRDEPPVAVNDPRFMYKLIRASFNERRKTLRNSLSNAFDLGLTKEEVDNALEIMGLDPAVRGETLDLEEFARLSDILQDMRTNVS